MVGEDAGFREARRRQVREWLDALRSHIDRYGTEAGADLVEQLERAAAAHGAAPPAPVRTTTPPVNSIPHNAEPVHPGDLEIEHRIDALVRWNAMAMVVRANREHPGLGGHISTYASAAMLFQVGFDHFFRGRDGDVPGDTVFLQGHASPGVYARAFVEGRLTEAQLAGFRLELSENGLPSYPHPRAMPDFWEFPSVSMGLAPLMGVHQARFDRYLQLRGLVEDIGRVFVVCGDGEMDEPESLAGLDLAVRENLSNLTFVVDCNLQRLDGPVRPNASVIDSLEARFHGAGWNVIKVLWGGAWDPVFERDVDGALVARLERTVDGDWQHWAVADADTFRDELFDSRALRALVDGLDERKLRALALGRGGHDRVKVHAAYAAALAEEQRPTVILAHTIKGYGLGRWGEGRNATHKRKTLDEEALRYFRDRFEVPLDDDAAADAAFVAPEKGSPEARYLEEHRRALGGPVPRRANRVPADAKPSLPDDDLFAPYLEGSGDRDASTTVILVRLLTALLHDDSVGELLVPIVPDEARTFGMEPLFRSVGIHAPDKPHYEPVDAGTLTEYRETPKGQLIEAGITEAGSMATAIAAGTAHVTNGVPCIPFYFFYSMFGFQRIGDLIWAAGDALARGFLIGATSGRTALNGEGLQHQDGHSHLLAMGYPGVRAFDVTFGFELAVLVREGLRRMLGEGAEELFYLTVANESYPHPKLPDGTEEGIVRGCYRLSDAVDDDGRVRLLVSGPLVSEALAARRMLESDHDVPVELFITSSWNALYLDALAADREARLEGGDREPWITRVLGDDNTPIVAVSDFVQHLPHVLARWLPGDLIALGTHGFGHSDTRDALRAHFEVDRSHIVHAALCGLQRAGRRSAGDVRAAAKALGLAAGAPPYPIPPEVTS